MSSGPDVDVSARLITSSDGALAATIELGGIHVFDVPQQLAAVSEIGLVGDLLANDVAFVGASSTLVVLARASDRSTLHVIEATGPKKLGELVLPAGTRIAAVAGDQILTIGRSGAVVDLTRLEQPIATLPLRTAITAAGSIGPARFLVAAAGVLEEWDTSSLSPSPARRLRLDRPIEPQFIGGSADRVWMVPKNDLNRVDIVSLTNRSNRTVELPEPAARAEPHPAGQLLLVLGASGAVYILDLTRVEPLTRLDHPAVRDASWLARTRQLVIYRADGSLAIVPAFAADPADPRPREPAVPAVPAPAEATPRRSEPDPAQDPSFSTTTDRISELRQRVQDKRGAPVPPPAPFIEERRGSGGWRSDLATWARAIVGRSYRPLSPLDPNILDEVAHRLQIASPGRTGLALLYGVRLIGLDGAAPYDLASAIDWDWRAVLDGQLAALGLVEWRRNQIRLVGEVAVALDEARPRNGTIAGAGARSTEPDRATIIAPEGIDVATLATWAATVTGGAVFIPNERGEARPERFLLEARVRGIAPLVRHAKVAQMTALPAAHLTIVPDEATANRLGLSVIARWPSTPPT